MSHSTDVSWDAYCRCELQVGASSAPIPMSVLDSDEAVIVVNRLLFITWMQCTVLVDAPGSFVRFHKLYHGFVYVDKYK